MKCSFCGKELEKGAEFCPECGMILSLGGVTEESEEAVEVVETEIPEYVPNVFRAMDFEQEEAVPAMELEVTDNEETAVVVEAIPEYSKEPEAEQETVEEVVAEEPVEETPEAVAEEEIVYEAPEYNPNAEVEAVAQAFEDISSYSEEAAAKKEEDNFLIEEAGEEEPVEAYVDDDTFAQEYVQQEAEEAYPVYSVEENETVPSEKPTEDASILASLFEDAENEKDKIEDITPVAQKSSKPQKNSFATVAVLVVVLAGIVLAGGYVFKNVLPKVVDTSKTTTAATDEQADATTKKSENTTTKKSDSEKTTEKTTKATTTAATTTEKATEKTTTKVTTEATTKETTTKAPETTTEAAQPVVVEPDSYNLDELYMFPLEDDINIRYAPSQSGEAVVHPYGYPVYAYAQEGNYYYVHSPYLDFMGWVSADDVYEYIEETTQPEEEVEEAPVEDEGSYIAIINTLEGLNFREGPGADYGIKYVVPGGFYVRVTERSAENPGWVYVTVEDSSYPYGSPCGWVLEDYLG